MNRIISINISGVLFNVDENAYDRLKHYLDAIKAHFQNKEGGSEILADIENRIAEMLLQSLSDKKEVVTQLDIERVIASMGEPEQMDESGEDTGKSSGSAYTGQTYNHTGKRLYRDEDDKVIGGVCSGISAYLGIDPVWLRLVFGIAFLFFGSGFLLYILLWVALPAAKTSSEKLEMRGENINISNIEKTVKANMQDIKHRVGEFGDEIRNFSKTHHARNAVSNISDAIVHVLKAIAFVIIRIVYFLAIFLGICAVISISVMVLSGIFTPLPGFIAGIFRGTTEMSLGIIAAGLLLLIPFLSLLLWGFNGLFHFRFLKNYVFGSLFFIWMLALIGAGYVGVHVLAQFSKQKSVTQEITLKSPSRDTLYIDANNMRHEYHWRSGWIKINSSSRFDYDGDDDDDDFHFEPGNVTFTIAQAQDKNYTLVEHFSSRGSSTEQASELAKSIDYGFKQNDSCLILDSQFKLKDETKWRNQKVKLVLKVPAGKVIIMTRRMRPVIYDIPNVDNVWDNNMPDKRWLMTENGLKCLDCPKSSKNRNNSSYENWSDDDSSDN